MLRLKSALLPPRPQFFLLQNGMKIVLALLWVLWGLNEAHKKHYVSLSPFLKSLCPVTGCRSYLLWPGVSTRECRALPCSGLGTKTISCLHFINEEAKPQRGEVTCQRSYSQGQSQDEKLGLPNPEPGILPLHQVGPRHGVDPSAGRMEVLPSLGDRESPFSRSEVRIKPLIFGNEA